MKFFDWFFGEEQQPKLKLPGCSKVFMGLDEDSLQVVIEMGENAVVMDREQFDYLYGESSGGLSEIKCASCVNWG